MKLAPLATLLATLAVTPALAQDHTPGGHFLLNWDTDGDGIVTIEEATTRKGDIFTAFDADEDGFLSGEEYDLLDEARANDQAAMQEEMGEGMGQGMGMGNGQGMGKGHGKGHGMGGEGMGMDRAFNDTDGDAKVSRAEFMARVPDWFAMMDKNGDGGITTDDFGPGN